MSGVTGYENKCKTLRQDENSTLWRNTMIRVGNEWKKLSKELPAFNEEGIFVVPEEDLSTFHILIMKKDDGPYKHIPFYFTISPCRNPENELIYPMIPPIVKYNSFCKEWIHPNIKPSGNICISILEYSYVGGKSDVWNPIMNIRSIVLTLSGLLNKNALKNEPFYSKLPDTDLSVIEYDESARYLCMISTLRIYEEMFDAEAGKASLLSSSLYKIFKEQMKERVKESLLYFKELCSQGDRSYKTYSFTTRTNFEYCSKTIDRLLSLV